MASWHLSDGCERISIVLRVSGVRADKSILIKYKYQSLLKQQRRDESSTWHLPQQDLATKLMCWRNASSSVMCQQLDTWTSSMKLVQFQRARLRTEQMIRWSWEGGGCGAPWQVRKLHEFRASRNAAPSGSFPLTSTEHLILKKKNGQT